MPMQECKKPSPVQGHKPRSAPKSCKSRKRPRGQAASQPKLGQYHYALFNRYTRLRKPALVLFISFPCLISVMVEHDIESKANDV